MASVFAQWPLGPPDNVDNSLLHVLLKIVTKCLVTRADNARDSCPFIHPHVNPYRPSRSRRRYVKTRM